MKINKEDIKRFKDYVKNHAYIVSLLGKKAYNNPYKNHDLDKREASGDTLELYVKRNNSFNKKGFLTKEEKNKIKKLIGEHVKNNSHHPEFWDDNITPDNFDPNNPPECHAENMTKNAIKEMCCDWAAVALKLNCAIETWYNKTIDKRFFFTKEQKEFIKKQLLTLEKLIKENDIRFPGFGKYNPDKKESFKEKIMEKKVAAVTFGRMNPPTIGHMKVCETLHKVNADAKFIYLSHTQDKVNRKNPLNCKNPLPYNVKYLFVKAFLEDSPYKDIQVIESDARTILDVAREIYEKGFSDIIFIVGDDRIEDFKNRITHYNGSINSKTNEVFYNFNSISVLSAGKRDELSGNEIEAMSASKLRRLAYEGNFEEFKKGVPSNEINLIKDLYNDVRYYMGILN